MSGCCTPEKTSSGTAAFFSRWSKRYAKRFRRGGLERVQKYLIEGIKRDSILGCSVLDVGCGVGQLHLALLKEGAVRSVGVDLSEEMIREARRFAGELGVSDRTEYLSGDFAQLSPTIPESDITVLDKVVCCHEDLDGLVRTSTGKTKRVYALSYPKENLMMKGVFKGQIAIAKLFRWSFRPFWHDWDRMKSLIMNQGFRLEYEKSTVAWQVLVFQRI